MSGWKANSRRKALQARRRASANARTASFCHGSAEALWHSAADELCCWQQFQLRGKGEQTDCGDVLKQSGGRFIQPPSRTMLLHFYRHRL